MRVMAWLKVLLALGALLLTPALIFGAYLSWQEGCFLCLEGEMAGSAGERTLNLVVLTLLFSSIGIVLWSWLRRSENKK